MAMNAIAATKTKLRKIMNSCGLFRARDIESIAKRSYKASSAMERQDWATATRYWKEIVDRYGNATPESIWINLCASLTNQGRFMRAERVAKKAMAAYPRSIALQNEYCAIALAKRDWEEVAKRATSVIKYSAKNQEVAPAYVRLSRAYAELGNYNAAEQVIEDGIKLHPEHTGIRAAYAEIAVTKEDWPLAAERWRQAINIFQEKAQPTMWVGLVNALRLTGKFKEAEKEATRGLSMHPYNVYLRMEQADIASAQQDWHESLRRWRAISEDMINFPSLRFWVRLRIRFVISVVKRIVDIALYQKAIASYKKNKKKAKVVVYTSFTGTYDTLKLPEVINNDFDYIVFTDEDVDGHGVYQVRPLNQPEFSSDGSRASRYPKTHPHKLLDGYDVAVWIDASIMITGDLTPMIEGFIKSGMPIGNATHPQRKSLAEEFEACIDLGKDDAEILKAQRDYYKKIGFETSDLTNNGVLFFNLKHSELAPVLEIWWEQIRTYSKRDQLSFNYALYKHGANRYHLSDPPVDIRNHPCFVFSPHQSNQDLLLELYSLL